MTTRLRTRGALVALEGIDGAGKSTLQSELVRRLSARGWKVARWREPTDRRLGRIAQRLATDDPWAAALEFTLDRRIARTRLERLLARNDLVISDRSFFSTLAYQGSLLSPSAQRSLAVLQRAATREPDRVVLLDLAPERAMARVARRGATRAPLERRRTLRRVAASYRRFASERRWWREDATAPLPEVADRIERRLLRWRSPSRGSPRGRG